MGSAFGSIGLDLCQPMVLYWMQSQVIYHQQLFIGPLIGTRDKASTCGISFHGFNSSEKLYWFCNLLDALDHSFVQNVFSGFVTHPPRTAPRESAHCALPHV